MTVRKTSAETGEQREQRVNEQERATGVDIDRDNDVGTVTPTTERKRTGSRLKLKGDGCEFQIVAHRGKVYFQFKSRRNRQWITVFVIGENGTLGLTSRVTQNYVPRAGEAPR